MGLSAIDPRTVFLMVATLFVVLPLSTLNTLAGQRSRVVYLWSGGGLLAAGGIALYSLGGLLPELLSLHAAYLMLIACLLAWCQTFRTDLGRPWPLRGLVAALLLFIAGFAALHHWGTPHVRTTYAHLVMFALTAHITWLTASIARQERSGNACALAAAYILISAAFAARSLRALLDPGLDPDPFSHTPDAALIPLASLFTAVVGSFGFLGMMLDRHVKTQVDALAERARLLESARLSAQIATLDHDRSTSLMAASLGHELNQPLTAALTNAQIVQKALRTGGHDAAALLGWVDKVAFNTRRAARILEKTRNLFNHSSRTLQRIELGQLVEAALEALEAPLRDSAITVLKSFGPSALWVTGDEVELSQVLTNVLRNAQEAMSQAPLRRLHIRLSRRDAHAVLIIEDSGSGLGEAGGERTGQAFFSTKEHGMGIGLSVSRTLIEKHKGSLTLQDAGAGAIVTIALPLAADQTPP